MTGDPDPTGPAIADLAWLEALAERVFPGATVRVTTTHTVRRGGVTVRILPPGVFESERSLRTLRAGLEGMRQQGRVTPEQYDASRVWLETRAAQVASGARTFVVPLSMLGNRDWRAIVGSWQEATARPLLTADREALN